MIVLSAKSVRPFKRMPDMTLLVNSNPHMMCNMNLFKSIAWFSTAAFFFCSCPVERFHSFQEKLFHTCVVHQGLGRQNSQMSLWPVALKSYGPFLKGLGHQGK